MNTIFPWLSGTYFGCVALTGLFPYLVDPAEQSRRNDRCLQNQLRARECSLQQPSNELLIGFNIGVGTDQSDLEFMGSNVDSKIGRYTIV
jgi:hypothetical protein